MTIECPPKIEKLLKSYYGDDFRLDMNLVSLEKTEGGYSGVARFNYYVFNALFGGDLESEFYMMTDTYVNIAVIFAVLGHLTVLYYLYLRNNHCGYKKVENVEFITLVLLTIAALFLLSLSQL